MMISFICFSNHLFIVRYKADCNSQMMTFVIPQTYVGLDLYLGYFHIEHSVASPIGMPDPGLYFTSKS